MGWPEVNKAPRARSTSCRLAFARSIKPLRAASRVATTGDRSAVWVYECAFRRGVNTRPIAYDERYTPIRRVGFVPDVPQPEPSLPRAEVPR